MESLYPGGIEHDANPLANSLGGKILSELGPDGATATMSARNLAPDDLSIRYKIINSKWLIAQKIKQN